MKTAQTGIGSDQRGQTVLTQTKRSPALGRPGFSLLNSHVDSELTRSGVTRVAEGHFQPLASKRRERRIGSEQDSLILTRRSSPWRQLARPLKLWATATAVAITTANAVKPRIHQLDAGRSNLLRILELTPYSVLLSGKRWGGAVVPPLSFHSSRQLPVSHRPGRGVGVMKEPRWCTRVSLGSQT